VVFDGVDGESQFSLAQFDEAFDEADGVLEVTLVSTMP